MINNFLEKADATAWQPAAVVVPMLITGGQPSAIYIQRTRRSRQGGGTGVHAGQIAFPGGRLEKSESPRQAALREFEEEIGVAADRLELLAEFGQFSTLTSNFLTTVYLGWLAETPALSINPAEVAAAYFLPLPDLLSQHDPGQDFHDLERLIGLHYHWQPAPGAAPICIWGMTGRVTWHVLQILYFPDARLSV